MDLWKKILLTLLAIAIVIIVIIVIMAIASKCKAENSQSSFCKFFEGAQNFLNDIGTAIRYAIYAIIAFIVFGILSALAKFGQSALGKGEAESDSVLDDADKVETGQEQQDITEDVQWEINPLFDPVGTGTGGGGGGI